MKVSEMIKELQKHDPNLDVVLLEHTQCIKLEAAEGCSGQYTDQGEPIMEMFLYIGVDPEPYEKEMAERFADVLMWNMPQRES